MFTLNVLTESFYSIYSSFSLFYTVLVEGGELVAPFVFSPAVVSDATGPCLSFSPFAKRPPNHPSVFFARRCQPLEGGTGDEHGTGCLCIVRCRTCGGLFVAAASL